MAGSAERTDEQVVRDVLSGDRDAYRLLVRRYGDVLFRHAFSLVGSQDDAADLVQTALVKGYRKLGTCRNPDRVGSWLFRILSNQAKDFLRSPRRRDVSLDQDNENPRGEEPGQEDPMDRLHAGEIRAGIQTAIARLTPEQGEAFMLKHVEGLSYEEMASLLDVSAASLKMRVHRAREALKSLLENFR